jgi:putative ATPase
MKELDYGKGYKNPHDFQGDHVAEHYLPVELREQSWYRPSEEGYERIVRERLAIWGQRNKAGTGHKKRGR